MTSTPSDPMPEQGATPPPPPEGAVPPPAYNAPPPGYQAPPPGYQAPPPGYAAPPPGYAAPAAPLTDAEQRQWAMFAHLGGILFAFVPALVIWLVFKERGRFVDEQAKEALNFQITWNIALIIASLTFVILIGIVLFPIVYIGGVIFMVMAGMAANKGQAYRYPVNVRLIK